MNNHLIKHYLVLSIIIIVEATQGESYVKKNECLSQG